MSGVFEAALLEILSERLNFTYVRHLNLISVISNAVNFFFTKIRNAPSAVHGIGHPLTERLMDRGYWTIAAKSTILITPLNPAVIRYTIHRYTYDKIIQIMYMLRD